MLLIVRHSVANESFSHKLVMPQIVVLFH